MRDSKQQSEHELRIFELFVERSGLPVVAGSIEKWNPPKPDIRCIVEGEGQVGFELSRLCHEEVQSSIARSLKTGEQSDGMWLSDVIVRTCKKKRRKGKQYIADYPIDLVLYSDGLVLPPSSAIPTIHYAFLNDPAPFQRVWFMGEPGEPCLCVLPWNILLSGWRYERAVQQESDECGNLSIFSGL